MDFSQHPLLDTTIIDQIRSFSEDDSMIIELFDSFTNDCKEMMSKINSIVSTNPSSMEVKGEVHSMKGVAGTIGAIRLHEIFKAIDAKLKLEETDGLGEHYQAMNECYNELNTHINETYLNN